MNRIEAIDLLVELSQAFGSDPMMVQGAGGNTSVKFESGKMIVKASGSPLKSLNEKIGWVELPFADVASLVRKGPNINSSLTNYDSVIDDQLAQEVDLITVKSNQKASIEAAMHAVLRRIVVHVHPVLTNVLLCSEDAEVVCKEIFQDIPFAWIRPLPPGYYLARAISDAVEELKLENFPKIVFLASHGVIVHADTKEEVHSLYREVLTRCEDWLNSRGLKVRDASFTEFLPDWQSEIKEEDIFPDTVVFKNIAQKIEEISVEKRTGIIETFAAAKMIKYIQNKARLKKMKLSKDISAYILGMAREKHRQNLVAKS